MTRGTLAVLLHRLAGEPAQESAALLPADVAAGAWNAQAIAWCVERGILPGGTPDSFAPDRPATREELAAGPYHLTAALGGDVSAAGGSAFQDLAQVSPWVEAAVLWAGASGILQGNNGYLNPQGQLTRAQLAAVLMRYLAG